jgi:hypothetical protein
MAKAKTIKYLINDPSTNDLIIDTAIPTIITPPFRVQNYLGGGYALGTLQGQAASCNVTITKCLNYLKSKTSTSLNKWQNKRTLVVMPRAGRDLNAYYDRSSLRFFYYLNPSTRRNFYTCDSTDIVAHELGHAVLDILRPDLFSMASYEVWAFHESFGDIVAMINILQWDAAIETAITQTSANLENSNIISKLAEEFGGVLYNLGYDYSQFSLRDAVNDFKYVNPEELPEYSDLDSELTSECHSFSRVFTGAWYSILVGMYNQNKTNGMSAKNALISARDTLTTYTLYAAKNADTIKFYNSIAQQMLAYDLNNNSSTYRSVMLEVFNYRQIIDNTSIVSLNNDEINLDNCIESENLKIFKNGCNKIKINYNHNIKSLSTNELEIEIPKKEIYTLDANNKLIHKNITTDEEIEIHTKLCLNHLFKDNKLNKKFTIKNGKLERKYFKCNCFR